METLEIVKALVSPAEKLIDAVSGAIGKTYEPKHIRKMAEAKVYELNLISETVRNNSDIPIVYDSTGVTIDTSNFEEIAKRASSRLAYQEITKQQNIENVIDNAYAQLEKIDEVSSEPVNQDWMIRFFNSVEDISDEHIQKIWSTILAGEIRKPNSYSYRTLEKLKNMTQQEIEYFQLVSSLAISHGDKFFILSNNDLMNKYNVYFSHLLELEECGLIGSQELSLTLKFSNKQPNYLYNSKIIGIIKGKKKTLNNLVLSVFVFTKSGSQLISAVHPNENTDYIIDGLKLISKNNQDFSVTAHEIKSIDDSNNVRYELLDLLNIQ